jgi:creatinine amidohydrolase
MRITDSNWMGVEAYLRRDDRAVVPLGSTEQHAYLSLSVDSILSERVALAAAEPLGVAVFPVQAYGITPYFAAFPGTVSLRTATYLAVLRDILDSLARTGFRRIAFVNGHGGNSPGQTLAMEWMADNPGCRVRWHNWWSAPQTMAKVRETDPVASHASWMENFAWTRLPGVELPTGRKPMIDTERMRSVPPAQAREILGDGNFGGVYQRPDAEMQAIWDVAVAETRGLIDGNLA